MELDLSTIEGLNEEVRRLFPALTASLVDDEDKASIGITINMKRVTDTRSMIAVTYKVKPTFPNVSHQIIAHADLTGNLRVEKMPVQMEFFPNNKEVLENE